MIKSKLYKEIKGIEECAGTTLFSFDDLEKVWKDNDIWNKKHPILAYLKELYRRIRYNVLDIKSHYYSIKWFIQRGKRGYADCDVWQFDSYLAKVIENGLKHLNKIKNSSPTGLTKKQWTKELNTIIKGFRAVNKMYDYSNKDERERLINKIAYTNGMRKFEQYFFDLWD